MSKLKDKLSANLRTVKSGQAPASETTPADKPAPPSVTKHEQPKPAAPSSAKPAPSSKAASKPARAAERDTQLFPTRVWPD